MQTRHKVLLVDDNEPIVRYLQFLLREPDIEFLCASGGQDALELARSEHPDLVLMDICMPGMDGLEVCDSIRNDPSMGDVRVALMSAIIGTDGVDDSSGEIGADAYFAKPLDADVVKPAVRALLGLAARAPRHSAPVAATLH